MSVEYTPIPIPGCEEMVAQPEAYDGPTAVDWSTGEVFRVHPAAAVFPMLDSEALDDLANNIAACGLQVPVLLDRDRQLIDGRNRLAACALAKVAPRYETFVGRDPAAQILALNAHRRHLTKGQKAMAVVRVQFFDSKNRGAATGLAAEIGISDARISCAWLVNEYAPELVDRVISGELGLDAAYADARSRKKALEEYEEKIADAADTTAAKLQRIQESAPDLAELIAEERISLDDAIAALDAREEEEAKRQQEERERCERVTAEFAKATARLHAILCDPAHDVAADWMPEANSMAQIAGLETLWTAEGLADIAERLGAVAANWRKE